MNSRKRNVGRIIALILVVVIFATFALASGGGSSSSSSYRSSRSSSSSKTYGAGGYEMPNSSDKSFSDYVKRVDPDLYNSMNDRYNSLK